MLTRKGKLKMRVKIKGNTIGHWILNALRDMAEERLEDLENMGAQKEMINRQKEIIGMYKEDYLNVWHDYAKLDLPFRSVEKKTRRNGEPYWEFNEGEAKFFPCSHYGMFIS